MSTATAIRKHSFFGHFGHRAIVVLWALACVAGLAALWRYESFPAVRTTAPIAWPSETKIDRDPGRPTLVMFVHPHCPCTRASLAELERIVAQSGGTIHPQVVFCKPADAPKNWERTGLWQSASDIPGAKVTCDLDAKEARRFQATTSGHTVLYSATGDLLYSGGITSSRGHEGDNDGRTAIVSQLHGRTSDEREFPVYGCPIVATSQCKAGVP